MGIAIPLLLILFTCLIIWRACDGFEIASEYVGRNMSEGVRGGTINAISSSIPELFTTLIALFVLRDEEGFSIGLGTTAGSALFNGMIIPALCIMFVVGKAVRGKRVDSVNVSTKVILRDGLSLIFCNVVLILLINGTALHWWQGLVLMLLYFAYFSYMLLSMKRTESDQDIDSEEVDDEGEESEQPGFIGSMIYWISGGPLLDFERIFVRNHHRQKMKDETWNAWPLLLSSTAFIGIACWLLVIACEWLGTGPANQAHPNYSLLDQTFTGIGMPAMFVAVIFAAMATSVPDTIMSIRDARDGDYDDAVANALGSNVFDICFALGFPLFVYTCLFGSIEMAPEVVKQSSEIRLLLLFFTILGFCVYFFGQRGIADDGTTYVEMRRGKALLLLLIYLTFVAFIIGRSADHQWVTGVSSLLQEMLNILPKWG
ncbi:sodium:calcium antiporter [Planctomycetes bacterium K23_9]|uniref:Putative calcium/sodium:proton antiporter n=1 Tax=Stieleria marina TaxID=1930275 RepID=A0A517NPU5_9BACT|nr:putative calcium/sodium:proton antiporter [Planctomycetes bacterium K23_9]